MILKVPYSGSLGELGAFRVLVQYDPGQFEYLRTTEAPSIRGSYSLTQAAEGRVESVYTLKGRESCLTGSGETYTYRFRVREGAAPGDASFFVSVFDLTASDSHALDDGVDLELSYQVLQPYRSDAGLLALSPAAGRLTPDFSPDCHAYELTVPFDQTEMTFSAFPADGAVCRINRKNLGAGGSDTLFLLTVTAEDGVTRDEYQVTVHREERPVATPAATPERTPKPAATPRPTAMPRPTSTPKPTTAPKSPRPTRRPALVASGTGSGISSSAPEGHEAVVTRPSGGGGSGSGSGSGPVLVIRNGDANFAPLLLAALFLGAVILISGPAARWLVSRFPEREKKPEKEETGDLDE